jgi:hypothetical protein
VFGVIICNIAFKILCLVIVVNAILCLVIVVNAIMKLNVFGRHLCECDYEFCSTYTSDQRRVWCLR